MASSEQSMNVLNKDHPPFQFPKLALQNDKEIYQIAEIAPLEDVPMETQLKWNALCFLKEEVNL